MKSGLVYFRAMAITRSRLLQLMVAISVIWSQNASASYLAEQLLTYFATATLGPNMSVTAVVSESTGAITKILAVGAPTPALPAGQMYAQCNFRLAAGRVLAGTIDTLAEITVIRSPINNLHPSMVNRAFIDDVASRAAQRMFMTVSEFSNGAMRMAHNGTSKVVQAVFLRTFGFVATASEALASAAPVALRQVSYSAARLALQGLGRLAGVLGRIFSSPYLIALHVIDFTASYANQGADRPMCSPYDFHVGVIRTYMENQRKFNAALCKWNYLRANPQVDESFFLSTYANMMRVAQQNVLQAEAFLHQRLPDFLTVNGSLHQCTWRNNQLNTSGQFLQTLWLRARQVNYLAGCSEVTGEMEYPSTTSTPSQYFPPPL